MDEREFDQFLENRFVPQMPSNMAHRIIEASCSLEQDEVFTGVKRWMRGFLEGFIVPQPAFALGVFLLIGLTLGILGDGASFLPGVGTDDLSLAFEAGDYMDAGDLL